MSSGGVRRAGVLGHPIAHSKSPVLHRAAYAELALPWTYDALDVTVAELEGFLAGLDESWIGLSLTMPLKVAVLRYLDSLTSPAGELGVVNTVVFGESGAVGHNTDVAGIQHALASAALAERGEATILGGGATARSALAAVAGLGLVRAVVVARRPEVRPGFESLAEALGIEATLVAWEEAGAHLGADLVISTVPASAADELAQRVDPSSESAARGVLLDVVYDPWPTGLVRRWRDCGGAVVPGWEMLLHQAAGQVELMTGRSAPISAMRAALLASL